MKYSKGVGETRLKILEAKTDELHKEQAELHADVRKVLSALGGDGLGNPGLITEVKEVKRLAYKNKSKIDKAYWFASVMGTLAGLLASMGLKFWDK